MANEGGPLATKASEIITAALLQARRDDPCSPSRGFAPIAGKCSRCRPFGWPTAAVVLLIVCSATAVGAIFKYYSVSRRSAHDAVAWSDEKGELEAENDVIMSVYNHTLADLRNSKAATNVLEAKLRSLGSNPGQRTTAASSVTDSAENDVRDRSLGDQFIKPNAPGRLPGESAARTAALPSN